MRFSFAILSVWSSAVSRRFIFTSGFVANSRKTPCFLNFLGDSQTIRLMSSSLLNQSKRPRHEEPSQIPNNTNMVSLGLKINANSSEHHVSDHIENVFDIQQRSPYERKLGKIITACPKCKGEGKVRATLSKKARARRKQTQQNILEESGKLSLTNSGDLDSKTNNAETATAVLDQPPKKPCRACNGTGLIAIPPSEYIRDKNDRDTNADTSITPLKPPEVAIVGGGIGGIALAAALQHRNIPCVVYERDLSFEERNQGYGLTMQQGARALGSLGFFSLSDDEKEENDANTDIIKTSDSTMECTKTSKQKFGIHSTRE